MKHINLRTLKGDGETWERFTTTPGDRLWAAFKQPGVRVFTTHEGIRIERDPDDS